VLPKQEAIDQLTEQAEQRAALLRLKASIDWGDDMLSVNGMLAMEYGLRLRAMEEEWARWAVKQIADVKAPSTGEP
jgi:PadR family transcriptional regulator AphA